MKIHIMSNKKSGISQISERVLELSRLYPTAKAFIEKCEISNYSLITDIKKGRIKTPGAEYLDLIVRGTGCSGTWLLTGEGKMFEARVNPKEGSPQAVNIEYAFKLLERIEQKANGLKGIELPPDVDVQLARLLLKVLEHRE
jgi:hypothetical protein